MRSIFFLVCIGAIALNAAYAQTQVQAQAQTKTKQPSKARAILQSAYQFQNKLADSTATVDDVIANWSSVARDPEVRKDPDALAIAYGSEGILEIQKGQTHLADSLLRKSLPLFRRKSSKEPVVVAYAEFQRGLKNNSVAIAAYDEIVHTMDSVPELWDIAYYRLSGYAPYAYAIDASFGLAEIAATDPKQRSKAIKLIQNTQERHPNDALGLMDIVALHWLGEMTAEDFRFKVDLLCSRKPELRKVADLFEKKFSELGKL